MNSPAPDGRSWAPIALDREAEVPLGTQLAWILRSRIASGDLTVGERLPGARELADLAEVNVNTVRSVYARLEEEGILHAAHGKGTFVVEGTERQGEATHLAAVVRAEAERRGLDPRAVAAAVYVEPLATETADAPADGVLMRRAIRSQIAQLERQLAGLQASHPKLAPERTSRRESEGGRLLSLDELTATRDRLAVALANMRESVDAVHAEARADRAVAAADAHPARPAAGKRGTQTGTSPIRAVWRAT